MNEQKREVNERARDAGKQGTQKPSQQREGEQDQWREDQGGDGPARQRPDEIPEPPQPRAQGDANKGRASDQRR